MANPIANLSAAKVSKSSAAVKSEVLTVSCPRAYRAICVSDHAAKSIRQSKPGRTQRRADAAKPFPWL